MDGFSTLANAMNTNNNMKNKSSEFASFGAIHLNNTSIQKSTLFWTEVVGMKLRYSSEHLAEFGTESKTLVVVHQSANRPYIKGYSGLYHFAIHAPNIEAFASMIQRLHKHKYPYSPVDHTMSKSVYLDDPDGINIEFTLETPERFKRVVSDRGLRIEGSDGIIRSASERLDVSEILSGLENDVLPESISDGSYIGHIHLYANNVQQSNAFYLRLGFIQFNHYPQFMYADLGAGGDYQHRIVMNSWHGQNRPIAPADSAGLRFYQIEFKDRDRLDKSIAHLTEFDKQDDGYWLKDPTGNKIFLT